MPKPIYILNGPNLNLLGTREPHIYGSTTLAEVEAACQRRAGAVGLAISFRQTNHEGQLVDWIQEAIGAADGIIINPAAYTHTSVAILDALKNFRGPIIELHISNPHQREEFRHRSFVTPVATATLAGFGVLGYSLAVEAMAQLVASGKSG
jgi:3-dehydroquinate dehydratase II